MYLPPWDSVMKVGKGLLSKNRWYSHRTVLPTILIAGILFVRTAFLALNVPPFCPPISCLGWKLGPRFFQVKDPSSLELVREFRKAYADSSVGGGHIDRTAVEVAPESLEDLIAEMISSSSYQHFDMKTFVWKTKAMLLKMDRKVQSSRVRASIYKYLASVGIPKSMHCLTLSLAEEYLINSLARSSLPSPEYAFRLTNSSFLHIVILSDNVLAASVAVSSTVFSSTNPDKIVFHIITDKKTFTAMHTWFALHTSPPAIVEVKGLHQFDWPFHVNAMIMETAAEIHRGPQDYRNCSEGRRLEALKPSSFSLLNHFRIQLPELFPKLERVIFMDDDVVVRRDLAALWELDLHGNVNGAVSVVMDDEAGGCIGKKLYDFMNFSDSRVSSGPLALDRNQCAWLGGMNIFDLKAWRRTNITQMYQHWLKLNRESGFVLWGPGSLPPALVAFDGHVHPINPSWHLSDLGSRLPDPKLLQSAAVLHFSGPAKPWLEIGFPDLRQIWWSHVNQSDDFISSCRVMK